MNHKKRRPPGIYPEAIARYAGTTPAKVEDICINLGIERWSLGMLGNEGGLHPLSVGQTARILGVIRARQGKTFLGRHGLRQA